MSRKWMAGLLILSLVLGGMVVYADQPAHLMVDREMVEANTMIHDGRTMVTLETLEEFLSVTASWSENQMTLTFAEKTMVLETDGVTAFMGEETIQLGAPMVTHGETAWVPLAAIARSFGHEVVWHPQTRIVEIVTRTNRLFSEYVRAIAATGSLLLNGEMGDLHEEIVASGEWDTPENEAFRAVLKEILDINEATYVYTLIKSGTDENPTLLISEAEWPDEYGDEYEMEPQFLKAFGGEPAYAVHFWDEDGTIMKSAFAPIYNTAGQVVAILGIDTEYDTMNHDANALISAKVKAIAATGSLLLNGEMGDLHEEIVASGEWDTPENQAFRAVLKEILSINNATYVYTLIKSGTDDDPTLLISEAEWPDEYGDEYEMEPQFLKAFSGVAAAAYHIWTDEGDVYKSAFAPIYNTVGEIVALLGIDDEAPELGYVHELE